MSGGGGPLQGRRRGARVLVPRFWGAGGADPGLRSLLEEAGGAGLLCTPERAVGIGLR